MQQKGKGFGSESRRVKGPQKILRSGLSQERARVGSILRADEIKELRDAVRTISRISHADGMRGFLGTTGQSTSVSVNQKATVKLVYAVVRDFVDGENGNTLRCEVLNPSTTTPWDGTYVLSGAYVNAYTEGMLWNIDYAMWATNETSVQRSTPIIKLWQQSGSWVAERMYKFMTLLTGPPIPNIKPQECRPREVVEAAGG